MNKHESAQKGLSQHQPAQTSESQQEQRRNRTRQHNPAGDTSRNISTTFPVLPPEIHQMVGCYLDQRTLAVCLRVCRAWATTFHAQLWRHLDISWSNMTQKSGFTTAIRANSQFVYSLKLTSNYLAFGSFLDLCPPKFAQLTSAHLDFVETSDSSRIVDFLGRGSTAGWKKFVLRALDFYSDVPRVSFFEALLEHAPTLETLCLENLLYVDGPILDQILCSAPNLKVLSISADRRKGIGYLDARTIVQSDWVCADLEVFECPIRNIPRPDITRKIAGFPASMFVRSGTFQESHDLQRQVYSKLAQLSKLRKLSLHDLVDPSSENHYYQPSGEYDHRLFDCLAMTVESGLDILRNLKDLRIVGLADMEVYIHGDKEQAWFAEHWPHANIWYSSVSIEDYESENTAEGLSSLEYSQELW